MLAGARLSPGDEMRSALVTGRFGWGPAACRCQHAILTGQKNTDNDIRRSANLVRMISLTPPQGLPRLFGQDQHALPAAPARPDGHGASPRLIPQISGPPKRLGISPCRYAVFFIKLTRPCWPDRAAATPPPPPGHDGGQRRLVPIGAARSPGDDATKKLSRNKPQVHIRPSDGVCSGRHIRRRCRAHQISQTAGAFSVRG